jgi:hypothetical protein
MGSYFKQRIILITTSIFMSTLLIITPSIDTNHIAKAQRHVDLDKLRGALTTPPSGQPPPPPPSVKILGAWEEAYGHIYIPYGGTVALTTTCMNGEPYCPEKINGGEMTFKVSIQSASPIKYTELLVDGRHTHFYGPTPAIGTGSVNGVYTFGHVHWGSEITGKGSGLHTFTLKVVNKWIVSATAQWKWNGGRGL